MICKSGRYAKIGNFDFLYTVFIFKKNIFKLKIAMNDSLGVDIL